jgi:(5-formylfuran-3-yl)methyl phosphate synthase
MTNDQAPMTKQAPNPNERMIGGRTGLLVSVRSAEEALVALEGGAEVVDVKEPRRGALGAANVEVWRAVQEVVGERVITSAALGEFMGDPIEALARQANGFRYAKIGLAGCGGSWKSQWLNVVDALPSGVLPVPVAYADLHFARSQVYEDALEIARGSEARMVLIDTFDKSGGGLLSHLEIEKLQALLRSAGEVGVRLALAGSLQAEDISRLVEIAPAYLCVRGAACEGGRDGTVDLARVKSLAAIVRRSGQLAVS